MNGKSASLEIVEIEYKTIESDLGHPICWADGQLKNSKNLHDFLRKFPFKNITIKSGKFWHKLLKSLTKIMEIVENSVKIFKMLTKKSKNNVKIVPKIWKSLKIFLKV